MSTLEINLQYGEDKALALKLNGQDEHTQNKILVQCLNLLNGDEIKQDITEEKTAANVTENKLVEGYKEHATTKTGLSLHNPKTEYKSAPEPRTEYGAMMINGEKKYQLFYICPQCGDRDKLFIDKGQVYCNCKECGKRLRTRTADHRGFPHKDEFNNYYIAGEFRRSFKDAEEDHAHERFEDTEK